MLAVFATSCETSLISEYLDVQFVTENKTLVNRVVQLITTFLASYYAYSYIEL